MASTSLLLKLNAPSQYDNSEPRMDPFILPTKFWEDVTRRAMHSSIMIPSANLKWLSIPYPLSICLSLSLSKPHCYIKNVHQYRFHQYENIKTKKSAHVKSSCLVRSIRHPNGHVQEFYYLLPIQQSIDHRSVLKKKISKLRIQKTDILESTPCQ